MSAKRQKKDAGRDEEKSSRFSRIVDRAGSFYRTYTAGLKAGDFRRLFTEETRGIYTHFRSEEESSEPEQGFKGVLRSFGRIFWGFLLALTPARRLLYGIAFIIFAIGTVIIVSAPVQSALRQDVSSLVIYSFIIASFLLALELADKLSARGEIEIARDVQLSMLPPEEPDLPGLEVASFSAPAADVGGDYYDFSGFSGTSCIAIGDVSGHGLAAGLVMAMAKSAWKAQLINNSRPSPVLATLNSIVRDAGSARTLMSFIHCVIEQEERRMVLANAGHIDPLLYRPGEEDVRWIESPRAYPLGVREQQKYESVTVELQDGDVLVFISDGAVESLNNEGESFGYERFSRAVNSCKDSQPSVVLDCILDALQNFVGSAPQEDDTTIIVARFNRA